MKVKTILYQQNNQKFLSLTLPFGVINKISEALIYGENVDGYQRKPNKIHYNKIKNYALKERNTFILPTSIILGADKEYIEPKLSQLDGISELDIDEERKSFRIVDGQHRVAGLREAVKTDSSINDFLLNVIVVLSEPSRRSIELEIFKDINSKAKRINTDLAELASHDYQIREQKIKPEEVNRHIGIKIAHYLKERDEENVWQNAIKFDIHSEVTIGIIGITLFTDSIKGIIDSYMKGNPFIGKISEGEKLIEYCQAAAEVIGKFLYDIWNDIIKTKWGSAFRHDIIKNDEGNLVNILYSKDFYIQKGIGIKSINPIISDIVFQKGFSPESKEMIKDKIFTSKVKIEHWKNGGPFAGFNSESGFSKIKKMILNELPVEN
jgi:DGQHR domain-containing protein